MYTTARNNEIKLNNEELIYSLPVPTLYKILDLGPKFVLVLKIYCLKMIEQTIGGMLLLKSINSNLKSELDREIHMIFSADLLSRAVSNVILTAFTHIIIIIKTIIKE